MEFQNQSRDLTANKEFSDKLNSYELVQLSVFFPTFAALQHVNYGEIHRTVKNADRYAVV